MIRMTFDEMAEVLGVAWCRGILPSGHYCHVEHHLQGTVTGDMTIHLTDRPHTRKANRLAFLNLAARVIDPTLDDEEYPWRRVYRRYLIVRRCASMLGIPNPAYPGRSDRAFVLAGVAGISNDVPMRKAAFDWARRGPKQKETGHATG